MLMMARKMCPLNNMQQCIGKKCVMYLDLTKLSAAAGIRLSEQESSDLQQLLFPPCALAAQGAASIIALLRGKHEASHPD